MKLVFGARGHIGDCVASTISKVDPAQLRVASSRMDGVDALEAKFPDSEAVHADMLVQDSVERAISGIDTIFVITPDFFDDRRGAEVLLAAIERLGTRPHIVRIQAELPGMTVERLPAPLSGPIGRRGHLEARALIEASGCPATFLNVLGYYMDDLLIHFAPVLHTKRTLLVPYDRPMCWIDPRELGEAAARVMMESAPPASRLIHLNNGEPGVRFSEVAAMIAAATGEPVTYDDSAENFMREVGPMLAQMTGSDIATEYLLADWRMEQAHPQHYIGSPALAGILGRKPLGFRDWMTEHADALLPLRI